MEDYPEELRTPPVSLVSVVGCPDLHSTISAVLHSEQPPINTLALPDFSKISILARKQRDPLDAGGHPPEGILKKDWLLKHRTRVPAVVAALFGSDQVNGDPAQWLQVCTDLENLKSMVRGRNIKLIIVIVQRSIADGVSEDLIIALRKRAEIEYKHLVMFDKDDPHEMKQSLNRLSGIFAELCNTYYREEGRRVKARIEKKTFGFAELNIRCCFKVAVYAEFRRDWAEALRCYEDAYGALREMVGTSTRLPPIQRLVEIKAVAEQLHFKISTLLLHGGKVVEALSWFHKHAASYERLVGVPEIAFIHWEWFSRQFLVFAELLDTSSASYPSNVSPRFGSSENPLTEWEFQPAYYYQLSAKYLRNKKLSLACSHSAGKVAGCPESISSSNFVGQYARLVEEGDIITALPLSDAEYSSYAITEAQRFQDSYEIIALLRRSWESFNSLKSTRMASYCANRMAIEYFEAADFINAKELFDSVAVLFRKEGWVTLLWETLGYLRECSRKLGSPKGFIEYSLEMAALPIFSNSGGETNGNKRNCGPAGLATLSQRERIQEEVFNLLKGQALVATDCTLKIIEDHPVLIEVDLVSPLRVVLLASVAFHDQSLKPTSSTSITLSLLSQLPHPVTIDQLEIQFNQPLCNFEVVNAQEPSVVESFRGEQGVRVEMAPSLTLLPDKWLRLTYKIKSEQSGKLECLFVKAKIGRFFAICCQAESPASMEDLPLWKFEDRMESFPTKDPALAYSGQRFTQVDEPEPQVDLSLDASGSALVEENFVVPVTVTSKGHAVHSGELKINLVDARGGGLLMSPKGELEPFSSDSHHVELLGISGTIEEDESQLNLDNIRKIQQSFGVVSVPDLGLGDTWSCKLEIKWHRPKSVMLYVSLGYFSNPVEAASQRVNVHKSLQIEGKTPVIISHRFMTPFRREPLLLTKVKSSSDSDRKISLALNEKNILIVNARNSTEVPLRMISMSIESNSEKKNGHSCLVEHNHGATADYGLLAPGEEFKQVFSVTPQIDSPNLSVGTVCIRWTRDVRESQAPGSSVLTRLELPNVNVEKPPLIVSLECPPHAVLGVPFSVYLKVQNLTSMLQEIKYSLGDSQSFVFSGPHNDSILILPKTEHIISYKLVPLSSGSQQLPRITITSVRYSAALQPSIAAETIFVYPSEPNFSIGMRRKELDPVSS
ncbi:trafficking protein particle complex subunit 11 isoform X1 [Dioscorea cayenensis subsp. rotundata]|uniref:Trafficking protein particle complex subunit 11 n=1 Tax=Dioscorea cayennensis subsp. rotundata TaxID=55577 RepID=A0AB40D211_DIOCR|nr:trafficking protein particle complex subunit 11 isoform X1 [Dioscorea cayenensis subsp. rotundata]